VAWLIKLSGAVDTINLRIGKAAGWLLVVMVAVATVNAIVRKAFDMSSNAWLELQWVLFAAVFLLCAPWALIANAHVRIDVVNSYFPRRVRHLVEIGGHSLFLIPFTLIIVITGLPFALLSVRLNEWSSNAGGLPQWPTKVLLVVGFALLLAQGVSELIKRIAVMRGLLPDPLASAAPHADVAADTAASAHESN
jgi:TRAP-type mannitol/chloroaromatic compound transport system permease small subunit